MKKIAYLSFFMLFAITACQPNKSNKLIGKWHAVGLDNPQMELIATEGQHFIDTVGRNNDAETNMALYGTANMDSFRNVAQMKLDSMKAIQGEALDNTHFEFRKDNIAILLFNGIPDTAKWHFDKDVLVLDELTPKGPGSNLQMDVVDLSDSVLKLKFSENNINSIVTFHPEAK